MLTTPTPVLLPTLVPMRVRLRLRLWVRRCGCGAWLPRTSKRRRRSRQRRGCQHSALSCGRGHRTRSKSRPVGPASADQTADWPRLADACGGLRHEQTLRAASGEPAGRGLSRPVFSTQAPDEALMLGLRAALSDDGGWQLAAIQEEISRYK